MKTLRILLLVAFMVFSGLIAAGCASRSVYVNAPPPAARHEVRPAKPFNNAVWISGHWVWRGNKYVWKSGQWIKPVQGKRWVSGHWRKAPKGYIWVNGRWN